MSLEEVMPEEEYFYSLLGISNPAILSEFTRSNEFEQFTLWTASELPWVPTQQITEMQRQAPKKKRIQGRNLGKSITCTDEVISQVIMYRGREQGLALVGTRSHSSLQHIFETMIIPQFTRDPFLNLFLAPGDRGVDRKNFEVRMVNGTIIKGRIQGKDGQGFNTVHPNICAWFDEVQYLSNEAVAEIYGMLGTTTPILASGVPNGVRSSWAYRIDHNPLLGFKGRKMTRLDDPRATPEWIEEMKELYGGESSSLYQQKMLGEWGADMRMTFDIDRINHDLPMTDFSEQLKNPPYYRNVSIDPRNFVKGDGMAAALDDLFHLSDDKMPDASDIWIHADHGITGSPTTGYVSFRDSKTGYWRQFRRFLIYQLQAEDQGAIFDWLGTRLQGLYKHRPWIGIDSTGQGGQAVASILENRDWKVVWANFAKNVEHAQRLETMEEVQERLKKDPWANPNPQWVNVEIPLKQVAIPRLRDELYLGNLHLVNQRELWSQLEYTTEHTTESGTQQKYVVDYTHEEQPHYDHDLQAFEVWAAMALEQDNREEIDLAPDMYIEEFDVGW